MIIAEYDSYDAYTDDGEYDEFQDEMNFNFFKEEVKERLSKRKFPVKLIARSSNWMGQDGYTEADNVDEIISKIFSFGNHWARMESTRGGGIEFRTASHDVPTGFTIEVRAK